MGGMGAPRIGRLPRALDAGLAVLAAVLAWAGPSQAEVVEGIAAVVDDDIILLSAVEERAAPLLAEAARSSLSSQLGAEQAVQVRRRVLAEMVDEALIAEQATKMRIRVSSEEVDRALKNMARQNRMSWPEFIDAIEKQGLGLTRYRSELQRQLVRFKVVQAKLQGRLRVSDREIEAFYVQQVRQARAGDRARVSHILVKVAPSSGAAALAERRRRAEAILARAKAGAPFAELAKRYSDEQESAGRGGMLGWVDAEELPAELRDVVLGLSAGELGGPVRTADGFHIVRVLGWEASDVRPLEEVREQIRMRLMEEQMEHQERVWLADLRRRAYVDLRLRQ